MADLREDHSWLEKELTGQLRMVSAPDTLWRGIHEQRRPLRVRPRLWMSWRKWPVATAALITVVSAMIWRFGVPRDPAGNLETLAGRELRGLADGTGKTDMRSNDPGEIRAWVRARSDIDVRLPERLPDRSSPGNKAVRLLGARMLQVARHPVAVITYKVGDDFAAMLVADAGINGPPHATPRIRPTKNMSWYSWSLGSDEYTIAFGSPQESQRACLLCHAIPPAAMLLR
jgi:hypothetical protein